MLKCSNSCGPGRRARTLRCQDSSGVFWPFAECTLGATGSLNLSNPTISPGDNDATISETVVSSQTVAIALIQSGYSGITAGKEPGAVIWGDQIQEIQSLQHLNETEHCLSIESCRKRLAWYATVWSECRFVETGKYSSNLSDAIESIRFQDDSVKYRRLNEFDDTKGVMSLENKIVKETNLHNEEAKEDIERLKKLQQDTTQSICSSHEGSRNIAEAEQIWQRLAYTTKVSNLGFKKRLLSCLLLPAELMTRAKAAVNQTVDEKRPDITTTAASLTRARLAGMTENSKALNDYLVTLIEKMLGTEGQLVTTMKSGEEMARELPFDYCQLAFGSEEFVTKSKVASNGKALKVIQDNKEMGISPERMHPEQIEECTIPVCYRWADIKLSTVSNIVLLRSKSLVYFLIKCSN
ncbi:unnamed protein product [Protopolystoma xenopodis]|uniref:Uncharacterized protein n=1 Tax=Protopolystoma xenopodis TaxID=117903 RepID=A0A448XM81_9PLAT|nr:unnamed protein product [Protopolystoma xenopodis]